MVVIGILWKVLYKYLVIMMKMVNLSQKLVIMMIKENIGCFQNRKEICLSWFDLEAVMTMTLIIDDADERKV